MLRSHLSAILNLKSRRRPTPTGTLVNGRWLLNRVTGTERYATEITRRLCEATELNCRVLVVRGTPLPPWLDENMVETSRLRGVLFDQIALPLRARGRVIVNAAGPVSLTKRRQVATLFDASVFRYPETFSFKFRTWYRVMQFVGSRIASELITISEFSAQELGEVLRTNRQLHIAPCAADHFQDLVPEPLDAPRVSDSVLMLGSLNARKNVMDVAEALSKSGVKVLLIGDGGGGARVFGKSTPQRSEMSSLVTRTGRISDEQVAWLFERAAGLVFPSVYEGFGLPIIEAQSRGCPVIASSSASMPEVTKGSARLFDPHEPQQAVREVREMLGSSEKRGHYVELGYKNAQRFSWDQSAQIFFAAVGRAGGQTGVSA